MTYRSELLDKYPVINDDNAHIQCRPNIIVNGERMLRGYFQRDWKRVPFASSNIYSDSFDIPLIPRDEWPDRIKEMDETKSRNSDLLDQAGLGVLNQDSTNYCWINAPVHCVEGTRVMMNQPMVRLSPASVGAKIKNFRNVGGWGSEGLRYLVEHGCCSQDTWPPNAISRQYDTPEADKERELYKVTEWYDVVDIREGASKRFERLMTCLFNRFLVAIGLNWWSHEVTAVDPVSMGSGRYGVLIDNSWGPNWGENGRSILTESKATPDDACVCRVAVAS